MAHRTVCGTPHGRLPVAWVHCMTLCTFEMLIVKTGTPYCLLSTTPSSLAAYVICVSII